MVHWETQYRVYREAKGEPMSDDQRRELLIGILPPDLSVAMMVEVSKHGDHHGLKAFIKEHVQILIEHGRVQGVRSGVNVVGGDESASSGVQPVQPHFA